MKKQILILSAALVLAGCSQQAAPEPSSNSPIAQAVAALKENPDSQNALTLFSEIFDASSQAYEYQFEISKENNGKAVNFLNGDALVQANSTDVSNYMDILQMYSDSGTVFTSDHVGNETLTLTRSASGKERILSAHEDQGAFTIFQTQEQSAPGLEECADDLWSELLGIEPLLSGVLYLCPLDNASYYSFDLTENGSQNVLTISVKDHDAFDKENMKQAEAADFNSSVFDIYNVENDTYTLTMDETGKLTDVSHDTLIKYMSNGIEQSAELKSQTNISKLDSFNASFYNSLFDTRFEKGAQFSLPE